MDLRRRIAVIQHELYTDFPLIFALFGTIYTRRRRLERVEYSDGVESVRRRRIRPVYQYAKKQFDLDQAHNVSKWLRFNKDEIRRLVPLLRLHEIEFSYRYKPSLEEALCITLARLSYPSRWFQFCDYFGCSESRLSSIYIDVIKHLRSRFRDILEWHPQLTWTRINEFADAIEAVSGVDNIWGFVDGTFRGIQRPGGDNKNQEMMFSGHKKGHGIHWQAIVTADGIISSLCGPYEGASNDWQLWKRSRPLRELRQLYQGDTPTLFLFGDKGYYSDYGIMCPYAWEARARLEPWKKAFNDDMASVRVSVEHGFAAIQQRWTYTAFSKALCLGNQNVAGFFEVRVLLSNCWTCIKGNQTSQRFLVDPPTLEEYLDPYGELIDNDIEVDIEVESVEEVMEVAVGGVV